MTMIFSVLLLTFPSEKSPAKCAAASVRGALHVEAFRIYLPYLRFLPVSKRQFLFARNVKSFFAGLKSSTGAVQVTHYFLTLLSTIGTTGTIAMKFITPSGLRTRKRSHRTCLDSSAMHDLSCNLSFQLFSTHLWHDYLDTWILFCVMLSYSRMKK